MGLYRYRTKLGKSLSGEARTNIIDSFARWMLVSLYQAGGSQTAMFKKQDCILSSEINVRNLRDKHNELKLRGVEISDRNGSVLLRNHVLMSLFRDTIAAPQS